jgi:hypothetical protein
VPKSDEVSGGSQQLRREIRAAWRLCNERGREGNGEEALGFIAEGLDGQLRRE